MAITRQTLLQAIANECASRRGPVPVPLVAIAANARSEVDRHAVDEMLVCMRAEKLVACVQDPFRGNGLVLTEQGQYLAYQKSPKTTPGG